MNFFIFLAVTYGLAALAINSLCAFVAYGMAKKRGLKPLPIFFMALFGSVAAVFYVAMFPVIVKKEVFPKEI